MPVKPRERVIRALNHEETDRPPFQATVVPEFADRLRFFGGNAVQSTLPLGTREEIVRGYAWLKNTSGKNGRWICAPTHHVQWDTPVERSFAMLDAIA